MNVRFRGLFVLFVSIFFLQGDLVHATSASFVPTVPTMAVRELAPGMRGKAYTVVSGTDVVSFPISVVSVIPQDDRPSHLIVIKAEGPVIEATGGIAAGMSGSPVYVGDRLVGAIGYGWSFSDHTLGLVTPIEDMVQVFSWKDLSRPFVPEIAVSAVGASVRGGRTPQEKGALALSGLSERARDRLSQALGLPVVLSGGTWMGAQTVETKASLKPGDALGVMLVWGDVTLGATGTLSALSRDGRFLAFAHPFLGAGAVEFPVCRAWIHHVIPSIQAPFKIGSFGPIVGTLTQDRPQAVGGHLGRFAPAMDLTLRLHDLDQGIWEVRNFRTVPDPFLVPKTIPKVFMGLVDRLWGRRGAGTAKMRVSFDGGGLRRKWSYTDYYFSPEDLTERLTKSVEDLVRLVPLNPFQTVLPLGVRFDLDMTAKPKILYADAINLDKDMYNPGETIQVSVDLRPYRGASQTKAFSVKVPEDTAGPCQVVVRGGGLGEPDGDEPGDVDRSISSLPELFRELDDRERNNEVIIELMYQKQGQEDMESELPPSAEFPGEIRRRKIKEGTMKVYRSEYYVEGSLQKTFIVLPKKQRDDL